MFVYNLKEKKTPPGKGYFLADLDPDYQLERHLRNLNKLGQIVPKTRAEKTQWEAEVWMCNQKIEYWSRRAKKAA